MYICSLYFRPLCLLLLLLFFLFTLYLKTKGVISSYGQVVGEVVVEIVICVSYQENTDLCMCMCVCGCGCVRAISFIIFTQITSVH